MAKQRIVNTKFWDDSYIAGLSPIEKLVFLYLLTNPLTNISGVYELPLRRAAFDVGIAEERLRDIVDKFTGDGKIIRDGAWVAVVNWVKYQTLNPKVRQGIINELEKAPTAVVDSLPEKSQLLVGKVPCSKRMNGDRSKGLRSIGELLAMTP